jgi:glycosyltransferase involved in cell wall biosynthesis
MSGCPMLYRTGCNDYGGLYESTRKNRMDNTFSMSGLPPTSVDTQPFDGASASAGVLSSPVTILAVVVLFNKKPGESSALNSVLRSAARVAKSQLLFKAFIFDNTPEGHSSDSLPEGVEYRHSPENRGLAFAYNAGLQKAISEGFEWLLTLDHDTTVPEDFLQRVAMIARSIAASSNIAAIVPEVLDDHLFISPNIVSSGRSIRLPKNFNGIPDGELAAINSATTWRVRTWHEFGGFNTLFWLDYLDLWAFHVIQLAGNRMYVACDLQVQHELSLLDPNNRMSPKRFENYLGARSAFCDLYKSTREGFFLTVHLAAKLCLQTLRHDSIDLRRLTWKYLHQRIFKTRKGRIDTWKKAMASRIASMTPE